MSDAKIVPKRIATDNGRELSLLTGGTGITLVVFESGLGVPAAYWLPVMRLLVPTHRVVAYDRAGYGGSDLDAEPRTLTRLAQDLVRVVVSQDAESVILVGHSWGGPIVFEASAAVAQKTKLVGLVAVDPSDPHFADAFKPWALKLQGAIVVGAARLGAMKFLAKPLVREMPEADIEEVIRAVSSVTAAKAQRAELQQFLTGLRQTPLQLPDVPIQIISGTKSNVGESLTSRLKINAAHRKTAEEVGGVFLAAQKSGHRVPCTEPELIAKVVTELSPDNGK